MEKCALLISANESYQRAEKDLEELYQFNMKLHRIKLQE
jgi:hypothetical protein